MRRLPRIREPYAITPGRSPRPDARYAVVLAYHDDGLLVEFQEAPFLPLEDANGDPVRIDRVAVSAFMAITDADRVRRN